MPTLNARVKFSGSEFTITNQGTSDWFECELELNGGVFSDGYSLTADFVGAGETYTVGAMQFTNSDGERFNPFTHKPQSVKVRCRTSGGGRASYLGAWN